VILGGIKRIGRVTSKLVPYMAAIYVSAGLLVLVLNLGRIPGVLAQIFASAFRPAAQIGGFAGGSLIFMLTWGVKRGLFSNESGQGSAPIAHAAARTDEPVREGVVAMLGPLVDTLIICSITGLVILTTGVWHDRLQDRVPVNAQSALTVVLPAAGVGRDGRVRDTDRLEGELAVVDGRLSGGAIVRNHSLVEQPRLLDDHGRPWNGELPVHAGTIDTGAAPPLTLRGRMALNGSPLTAAAFQRGLSPLGGWGRYIITLGVLLFGLSTAISWSYYGDRAMVYLAGPRYVLPYKIVFCVMQFLGAIFSLEIVWNLGDSALGLMALPNLLALLLLLGVTRRLTGDYFAREHPPLR